MNTIYAQIKNDIYYVGVNDRSTQLFENMWPLPKGVAYNSYLIKGEKTALLDTVRINKVDGFTRVLSLLMEGRDLDYLIINHMEPDHSGSIMQVLEMYPDVTFVGNKKTFQMLEDYFELDPENKIVVADGDTLDLGDRELTFYTTPMVHWPESMVTYSEKDKVLFSQDIFGGYGSVDGSVFDDDLEYLQIEEETRRYYSNIVGKYSIMAKRAIEKLGVLDIEIICPVHGFVWRKNPKVIIETYRKLANYETEKGVVIAFGSMYGNTENMADHLARYLAIEGVSPVKLYDVSKTNISYILSDIWKYEGVILGACAYDSGLFPKMHDLVNILKINKLKNHVLGIFGSYGWSGGAVKELKKFSEATKINTLPTMPEARGRMHDEEDKALRQLAKEMAAALRGEEIEIDIEIDIESK